MAIKGLNNGPTFLSLFAGGGGLHLGLKAAGFVPILATDIERSAAATFASNEPDLPFIQSDLRHVTKAQFDKYIGRKRIDLVAGGPGTNRVDP